MCSILLNNHEIASDIKMLSILFKKVSTSKKKQNLQQYFEFHIDYLTCTAYLLITRVTALYGTIPSISTPTVEKFWSQIKVTTPDHCARMIHQIFRRIHLKSVILRWKKCFSTCLALFSSIPTIWIVPILLRCWVYKKTSSAKPNERNTNLHKFWEWAAITGFGSTAKPTSISWMRILQHPRRQCLYQYRLS